jgi:hypothetical protein
MAEGLRNWICSIGVDSTGSIFLMDYTGARLIVKKAGNVGY